MARRFTGFVFLDSPERIHVIGWDPEAQLWKVPCGLVPPRRGAVTYQLDKPICRTCDAITRQVTPEDMKAIWKDAPR